MSEWAQVPFEDLLKESVRNGIYKSKEFHGTGVKIVNMGELFGYPRLRGVPMKRVELNTSELERFSLNEGDLIFARRSLTAEGAGKCSIVLELDGPTTFESSIIRARPDQTKANPLFLYYFFLSPTGLHRLDSIKRQVAVAGITGSDLAQLIIPKPPLEEQIEIASILGTLDDKIELNRQMNETLEAMARAIFKDWFVDFGPTRAKMEGRAPYLAPEIWSLFPDRLDDEGKPEGWEERLIDGILDLAYGKALPATERVDGPVPVYGSGGVTGYHNKALVLGPSVIVGRKGTVGALYWEDRPFFPIDTVFYVVPKVPLTFVFYLLQTLKLTEMNTDAAVPGLNRNNVYRLSVSWSPPELRTAFDDLVTELRTKISANERESQTLAATRDLLLPKLMSGEIRVKNAEKALEAVA